MWLSRLALLVTRLVELCLATFAIFYAVNFFSGAPRCPDPQSIQTEFVKQNFSIDKFMGTWYELAFHDYTQPIGLCGCERSYKHYHPNSNYIFDNFTLLCYNDTYFNNLTFDLNGHVRGHMVGRWTLLPLVVFPNTVVALGVNDTTQEYDWVIEFQCVEFIGQVVFTGINFYNRDRFVPEAELQLMLDTARRQGIGYWMDTGLKVHIVDHHDCAYVPPEEMIHDHPDHH